MSAKISANSLRILDKRYFDKSAGEDNPEKMFKRISGGNPEYYEMLSGLLMLPNSPTIFNLGTKSGGTLSACFVFDIADMLLGDWPKGGDHSPWSNSILGTTFKAACVAKAGGGVGYYLGNIREEGAPVKSTHKFACGPVAVLHWLNRLRNLITQGGKRDLAQMAILPAKHKDARKFIHCKDLDPQALSSFNISVSWEDDWLQQIDWDNLERDTHFDSPTGLWWEQCSSAWRTGDPGTFFWTTTNRFNATPHLGDINATNPCGETPNISDEPCNLGSLALLRFLIKMSAGKYKVDWDKLKHYVRTATRYLDDILDWNEFPHPDITRMALATRKLGLGVMGWADMLAMLRIPYDTQDAVDLGEEVMKTINETALDESIQLGVKKGAYPAYNPDDSPKWAPKCRNSTRTSIAPTGTISIIAECEPGIEPHYALERERTTYEGIKMTERVQDWLPDLGDFVPKTAKEIDWKWHVKHQAVFQKHTNLGVSKTINLPNSATVRDISGAYRLMWESGCKGGTVFRDGCRNEQVLVERKTTSVYSTSGSIPKKKELGARRPGWTEKFKVGGYKVYLTSNSYSQTDSELAEIWLKVSPQQGSTVDGMLDSFAKMFSKALQNGVPLEELIKLHKNSKFEPSGLTGHPDVPICSSIPDLVVRFLEKHFLKKEEPKSENKSKEGGSKTGTFCPDCGKELINIQGCNTCLNPGCGFSKCG
jgi:ribonucleoside-diphosphate reductase alpha chain